MSETSLKKRRPALKFTRSFKAQNATSGVFSVNQSRCSSSSYSRKSSFGDFKGSLGDTKASLSDTKGSFGDNKGSDKNSSQTMKYTHQVFDETGLDVTPRPLYYPDSGILQAKQGPALSSILSAHNMQWSSMLDQITTESVTGPFTRSFGGSVSASMTSLTTVSEHEGALIKQDSASSHSEETKTEIRDEMLDKVVNVYLTETESIWLLDIPPSVPLDSEKAEAVRERNKAYMDLCENRQGNDRYVERGMKTINGAIKTKEVQCEIITSEDKAVSCTAWEIYDCVENNNVSQHSEEKESRTAVQDSSFLRSRMSVLSSTITVSGSSIATEIVAPRVSVMEESDSEKILQSVQLRQSLAAVEKLILLNIYQPMLAAYKHLPAITELNCTESEHMQHLWTFHCELTIGRNITSITRNQKTPDLLAVSYGELYFDCQKPGLVCCWSYENIAWPCRVFHCAAGVTALDFSACHENWLAVGMYNGNVAIYNVQNTQPTLLFDSSDITDVHRDPVWEIRWVENDRSQTGEDLISVSDGRVSKWLIHEGLDCVDLIKLQKSVTMSDRTTILQKLHKFQIQSLEPAMCFDFQPCDPNIYLVGTVFGKIYKCSCSDSEKILTTYEGHKGPVFKVRWSPFHPDVFLSCSSERCFYEQTIYLWRQDFLTPVLQFSSSYRPVCDIMWSPLSATLFGVVGEGKMEFWDLKVSTLDPVIVNKISPEVTSTALLFLPERDCVVVGDSEGQVSMFKMKNLSAKGHSQMETLEEIIQSTMASRLCVESDLR